MTDATDNLFPLGSLHRSRNKGSAAAYGTNAPMEKDQRNFVLKFAVVLHIIHRNAKSCPRMIKIDTIPEIQKKIR